MNNETTIFIKKEISIEKLINWIKKGPYIIDLFLTEGFRKLEYPTILCLKDIKELEPQLTKQVKMISGIILSNKSDKLFKTNIPMIEIQKDLKKFIEIFNLN